MIVVRRALFAALITATAQLGAAQAPPAHAAPPVKYGVNIHFEQPIVNYVGTYAPSTYNKVLDLMKAGGSKMVRLPIPWVWIEPNAKGQYDQTYLAKVDALLAAANSRGIKSLVTTGGPPCWATSYPNAPCGTAYFSTPGGAYPPRNPADAGDYAAFVAKRWSGYLSGIEVLNEPNSDQFFQVPPGDDKALDYTNIVKAEYAAVKKVKPAMPVVAGSLAFSDTTFLQSMYNDGIAASSDAISIHPYNVRFDDPFVKWGDPSVPWPDAPMNSFVLGVPNIHNVMVANGDGAKPLWLTEFGFSDCNPNYLCMDQTTQSQYMQKSLDLIKTWTYVKVALMHQGYDFSANRETWNGWGLLRNNYSRRPVYCTFALAAGVSSCQSDPLSGELNAQQALTRAWQLGRAYYLAHGRSFNGFDANALHAADSSFTGYVLQAYNVAPSPTANPKNIGIYVSSGTNAGTDLEVCNVSTTMAYCVYEHTGNVNHVPAIAHGKASAGTYAAAGATNNGVSTTW